MRMEATTVDKVCVFKLVTIVATGGQLQWGIVGDSGEQISEFSQLRVKRLGHLFTSSLLSLVEDCFQKH